MPASVLPLLALCSMIILGGVSCYHFPRARAVLDSMRLLGKQDYKRQTDFDQCFDEKLSALGVDSTCINAEEGFDFNIVFGSQLEVDSFFNEFCKPECGNAILQAYECCDDDIDDDIDDDEQSIIDYFISLCETNQKGEKCYEHYTSALGHSSIEQGCFDDYNDLGVCLCDEELSDEVEEQGCCINSYIDFVTEISNPREFYSECSVDLPEGCNNSPIGLSEPPDCTLPTGSSVPSENAGSSAPSETAGSSAPSESAGSSAPSESAGSSAPSATAGSSVSIDSDGSSVSLVPTLMSTVILSFMVMLSYP